MLPTGAALGRSAADRLDRLVVGLLIGLSLVFSLVPTSFSMGTVGPEATHQIIEGSWVRQVQFGGIFLAAAWIAWRHLETTLQTLRGLNPFLVLLLAYCACSLLWSPYPMLTLKRVVLFIGVMLTGIAAAPPVSLPRQLTRAMLAALFVLIVISALVAVAVPHIGVDYDLGGAWRGIMWQKNLLGSIAGFCVMLWLREWLVNEIPRSWCLAAILFSVFVLVMAKSTTAILVTMLGVGIYLGLRRKWMAGEHAMLMVSLGLAALLLASLHLFYVTTGHLPTWDELASPITGLFNKSTDLTGRTEIWRLALLAADQHPVWGIGYGAFWVGDGGPAQFIADQFGWMPSNAHNGYIDILNELGMVGASIFGVMVLWHAVNLAQMLRIDREEAAIHAAIFALIIVSNFSESQLLRDVSFQNVLIIYSSITVSATLVQHRRQQKRALRDTADGAGRPAPGISLDAPR